MKDHQKQYQLEPVNFQGDTIYVVDHNSEPFVPLRPVIEGMGLDWSAQYRRFHRNERFKKVAVAIMATQLQGDTQTRQVVCIPLRKLPGFLATIDASRVSKDIRPKILAYQNECDDALWNYWTTGHAVNPRSQQPKISHSQPLPLLADLAEQFQQTSLALNSPNLTDQQRWDLASKITAALFGEDAAYLLGEREVNKYRSQLSATLTRDRSLPCYPLTMMSLGEHGLELSYHMMSYFFSSCCRVEQGNAASEEALYNSFALWFNRAFDHAAPHLELFCEAMAKQFRRVSLAGQPWYLGLALLREGEARQTATILPQMRCNHV